MFAKSNGFNFHIYPLTRFLILSEYYFCILLALDSMKIDVSKFTEVFLQTLGLRTIFILVPVISVFFLTFPFFALYVFDCNPLEVFTYTATEVFGYFLTTFCCWSLSLLVKDYEENLRKTPLALRMSIYAVFGVVCFSVVLKLAEPLLKDTMSLERLTVFVFLSSLGAILSFEKGFLYASDNLLISLILVCGLGMKYLEIGPLVFFIYFTVLRIACWIIPLYLKTKKNKNLY